MHTDVVFEDMSLRTQVIGRIEATAYLGRILAVVPYGRSSRLRHVVGSSSGGGFEWTAGPTGGALVGITALELDSEGLITRITSVYDSRQLEPERKAALIGAAFVVRTLSAPPIRTQLASESVGNQSSGVRVLHSLGAEAWPDVRLVTAQDETEASASSQSAPTPHSDSSTSSTDRLRYCGSSVASVLATERDARSRRSGSLAAVACPGAA
jgi:hypothetical protein